MAYGNPRTDFVAAGRGVRGAADRHVIRWWAKGKERRKHEEPGTATTPPAAPSASAADAAAADDAFGADLYQLLTEDTSDTVFSPVSVASALQMALCGARGQTAAELASALHGSPDTAAEGLRAVSAAVRDIAAGGAGTFRAPSPLWGQD